MADAFDAAAFADRFDHHTREFGENIDAIYRYLRARSPVRWVEAYGGFHVLSRYADIVRVVRDDETFSLRAGMTIPSNRQDGDPPWVVPGDLDPPHSYVYRRLLEPLVTPAALTALEPFVRQVARELVDGFIANGEADLVQDLAVPLTAIVTLRITGLPQKDWPNYVAERRQMNAEPLPPEVEMRRINERFTWSRQAFLEAIERQRREPIAGSLIARLIEARIDGRPLEEWEYIAMLINFVVGGLETTQALLGSAWVHLARHSGQRADLAANPALMPGAVEEMLRFFNPQPGLIRVATRDTEIGGVPVRQGEKVLMSWASANRDEDIFPDADTFDFRRKPNRHLTFGAGAHHCLGANLTRLEARVCMDEVLRRLPDYRLVEEGIERMPDCSTLYGYLSVPVTFTSPAA